MRGVGALSGRMNVIRQLCLLGLLSVVAACRGLGGELEQVRSEFNEARRELVTELRVEKEERQALQERLALLSSQEAAGSIGADEAARMRAEIEATLGGLDEAIKARSEALEEVFTKLDGSVVAAGRALEQAKDRGGRALERFGSGEVAGGLLGVGGVLASLMVAFRRLKEMQATIATTTREAARAADEAKAEAVRIARSEGVAAANQALGGLHHQVLGSPAAPPNPLGSGARGQYEGHTEDYWEGEGPPNTY